MEAGRTNEPTRRAPCPSSLNRGDATCGIGSDTASPVSDDYTVEGSRFSGTVNWSRSTSRTELEDVDHIISPEERLKIAMARQ